MQPHHPSTAIARQPDDTRPSHSLSLIAGRIAESFAANPRLTVLVILLATAAGVSSFLILPRMEDPILQQRAASVTTFFPGADAERVEALVTEKLEEELLEIPEIKRVRSQSRLGVSFLAIELRDELDNTEPVWSRVRSKLEDAIGKLPAAASRPEFELMEIAAYAWIGAVVWDHESPSQEALLRRLARDLRDRLRAVPGTKEAKLFGDPGEQVLIEIDPLRTAAVGMSASDVANQLALGDAKRSAGVLYGEKADTVVEVANQFDSVAEILATPILAAGSGNTVHLRDVATVSRGVPTPPLSLALIDGRPGVAVGAMLRGEIRIDRWSRSLAPVLDQFRAALPQGISLDVLMEQEPYVAARLSSLATNLVLGACAVSVVTLLMMGARSAVIVTMTLPLASLMVLAGMRFLSIPIHQMSITGLIIALGLLIDNAIIVVDEVAILLRDGHSPASAVRELVRRLFAPLVASTVTTALAFAPIALMDGPAGEFVGSIAITVMLAIFSSLLLALTVIPALTAWFLYRDSRDQKPDHARSDSENSPPPELPRTAGFLGRLWDHGIDSPFLSRSYLAGLRWMLARPIRGMLIGAVLPICGFLAATQLVEQFFPPADRDQFYLDLELPTQTSLSETLQLVQQIDRRLRDWQEVQRTDWFVAESAPMFYYNMIARRKGTPSFAQAVIRVRPDVNPRPLIHRLQLALDREFTQARLIVRQLEQGPPFAAPLEVRILGDDLELLQNVGDRLHAMASRIPEVLHVRTDLSEMRPVAKVQVAQAEARWAGLSAQEIAAQLSSRLEGVLAGSVIEATEEIPVRVRVTASQRGTGERLLDADLLRGGQAAPTGNRLEQIPVAALASVRWEPQRAVINRYNGRRVNELQGFIVAGVLPAKVLADFQEQLADIRAELPVEGFAIEYGGEASERDNAVALLMANVVILGVGMVGTLVLALGSFRLAALIGLVAVLSVGLGLGSLWLFDYPFGFMAIIGTMGLIGVAINDSIVVIAALRDNPQARTGELEAVLRTILGTTRHVLATTFTTMVGFLPLLLSGGSFWPPLAVAIGGGVGGATLVALSLVPAVYRWGFGSLPTLAAAGSVASRLPTNALLPSHQDPRQDAASPADVVGP